MENGNRRPFPSESWIVAIYTKLHSDVWRDSCVQKSKIQKLTEILIQTDGVNAVTDTETEADTETDCDPDTTPPPRGSVTP